MSNPCEEHMGEVLRVRGGRAYVEIVKTAECNGCKACFFASSGKKIVLPALNAVGAKRGDRVCVVPPLPRPIAAYVMLFVLPMITLLSGLFIAYAFTGRDLVLILSALAGLAAGLIAVLAADRAYFSKKYMTKIVSIIQGEEKND